MAEISLREYLAQVDALLRSDRFDEAIAHSTRILEFYPKNAQAYQQLGQALMQSSRYEEAVEIFRRLLAALPNDFDTHYQLGIAYQQMAQYDQALWHLERAFDQQPGNATLHGTLKTLYQQHRQIELQKIQLTIGAVAKQHINSGHYEDAVQLLQQALRESPQRTDWRVMLAVALWEAGEDIDAAENALEVLQHLPYALPANRILTELWLAQERPSDAQRYLSRIEDVDPYLAFEIATNADVEDDTFVLEPISFAQYAGQQALKQDTPDWLANLEETVGSEDVDALDDWLLDVEAGTDEDLPPTAGTTEEPAQPAKKITGSLENLLPDSDSEDLSDLFGDDELQNKKPTGVTGLLRSLDEQEAAAAEAQNDEDDDSWLQDLQTGAFDSLDDQPDFLVEDSADDWLSDFADDKAADAAADWLDDSADETQPEPAGDVPNFFDDLDELQTDAEHADSMAWLSEADEIDEADVADALDEMTQPDVTSPRNTSTDESLAWMQDDDIEYDDNAPDAAGQSFVDEDPISLQSQAVDPMAWLQDDDALLAEADFESTAAAEQAMSQQIEDFFADDDMDSEPEPQAASPSSKAPTESAAEEAEPITDFFIGLDAEQDAGSAVEDETVAQNPNWYSDDSVLDEMLDLESLTEADADEDFYDVGSADSGADDLFVQTDWQADMSDQPTNWQTDDDNGLDDLEWLDEEAADGEAQPQAQAEPADELDPMAWLNAEEAEDILLEDSPADTLAEYDEFGLEDDFELDEEAVKKVTGMLDEDSAGTKEESQAQGGLTGMLSFFNNQADSDDAADDELSADWAQAFDDAEAEAESFDWSAGSEDELAQTAEPQAAADSFDWGADLDDEGFEGFEEQQPVAETDADWLADLDQEEAQTAEPQAAADSFDWGADLDDEGFEGFEEQQPVAETDADWLADLDQEEAQTAEPQAAADSFDWGGDFEEDVLDDDVSEELDWMVEPEIGEETAPVNADTGEWADDFGEGDLQPAAQEAQFGTQTFDESDSWLDGPLPFEDQFAAYEDQVEQYDDHVEQVEAHDASLEQPEAYDDQYAEPFEQQGVSETAESQQSSGPADAGYAWDDDYADYEEYDSEPAPVFGMTGMLNQIRSQRSFDDFDDEEGDIFDAPEEDHEDDVYDSPADDYQTFDVEADSETSDEDAAAEPDWLQHFAADDEEALPLAEKEFEALADTTVEQSFDPDSLDEEEIDPAPASNAPDWLNAMVPGLDVDYTAQEDEALEDDFIEETSHRRRQLTEDIELDGTGEFDWLQNIINEETGPVRVPPAAKQHSPPPPDSLPAVERQRFDFSQPPAWLHDTAMTETPVIDHLATDDGTDLPDYLDFDDIEADLDLGLGDDEDELFEEFDDFDDIFEEFDDFDDL